MVRSALGLVLAMVAGCSAPPAIERITDGEMAEYARAVLVQGGGETLYVSGVIAGVADEGQPEGTLARYGDTETQTESALTQISGILTGQGFDMSDVVKVQVFLVADPRLGGRVDEEGFKHAYGRFFGASEHSGLPARTRVQVAGLSKPGLLVEIEVTAAR